MAAVLALLVLFVGRSALDLGHVQAQLANTFPTTTAVVPGGTLMLAVTTASVTITGTSITTCSATTPPPAATVTYTCPTGLNVGTLIAQTFSVASGPVAETVTYNANGPATAFPQVTTPTSVTGVCFNATSPFTCSGQTPTTVPTVPGGTLLVRVQAPVGRTVQITDAPNPIGTCTTTSTVSAVSPVSGVATLTYTCLTGQSVAANTTVSGVEVQEAPVTPAPQLVLVANGNATAAAPIPASPAVPTPTVQSMTIGAPAATTAPAATPAPTAAPAPSGPTATYAAGWNLVSAPTGTVFSQAQNPLYTFQGNDTVYQTLTNTSGVTTGFGYWAYFSAATTVTLSGASGTSASVPAPAGHWVMVGNPSATASITVRGADIVYTYDPVGGYVSPANNQLGPGRGAWAISNDGGTITVGP